MNLDIAQPNNRTVVVEGHLMMKVGKVQVDEGVQVEGELRVGEEVLVRVREVQVEVLG